MDLLPVMHDRYLYFKTKKPGQASRLLTIVEPFNWQVWSAVAASICLAYLALVLVGRFSARKSEKDYFLIWSIALGVMINEGVPDRLLKISGKDYHRQILLFFWIPMACLIGMAYQSDLRAALIKTDFEKPVDSYQDVLDQNLILLVAKNTVVAWWLSNSPIDVVEEAFLKRSDIGLFDLVNGRLPAWVMETVMRGEGVIETTKSREFAINGHRLHRPNNLDIGNFNCGYFLAPNHPLKHNITKAIGRFVQGGLYIKLFDEVLWKTNLQKREDLRNEVITPLWSALEVNHVLPIFLLQPITLACAVAAFVVEKLKVHPTRLT